MKKVTKVHRSIRALGRPINEHLCPVGRKDEEKRHYHEDVSETMFRHTDDKLPFAVITVHFERFPIPEKKRTVVYPYVINISAIGGARSRALTDEDYARVGKRVARIMSGTRMFIKNKSKKRAKD